MFQLSAGHNVSSIQGKYTTSYLAHKTPFVSCFPPKSSTTTFFIALLMITVNCYLILSYDATSQKLSKTEVYNAQHLQSQVTLRLISYPHIYLGRISHFRSFNLPLLCLIFPCKLSIPGTDFTPESVVLNGVCTG